MITAPVSLSGDVPDPAQPSSYGVADLCQTAAQIDDLPYQTLRLIDPDAALQYLRKELELIRWHLPASADEFVRLECQLLRHSDPDTAARYERLERQLGSGSAEVVDLRRLLVRRAAPQAAVQLRHLQLQLLGRAAPAQAVELRALQQRLIGARAAELPEIIEELQRRSCHGSLADAADLISSLSLYEELGEEAALLLDELWERLSCRYDLRSAMTHVASMAKTAFLFGARQLFERDDGIGQGALALSLMVMMIGLQMLRSLRTHWASGSSLVACVALLHLYYARQRRRRASGRRLTVNVMAMTAFLMILIPIKFATLERPLPSLLV